MAFPNIMIYLCNKNISTMPPKILNMYMSLLKHYDKIIEDPPPWAEDDFIYCIRLSPEIIIHFGRDIF